MAIIDAELKITRIRLLTIDFDDLPRESKVDCDNWEASVATYTAPR